MQNNIVSKSNELIMANYSLTRHEQNLILACVSQIDSRPEANLVTINDEFVVTVEEIKNLFYNDSNKANIYRDLKSASDHLFSREVYIDLPDNEKLRTRFISGIKYQPDKAQVTLTFAQNILPYLTQLRKNFTSYKLIETVQLTSIHAVRLYEMVVCWSGQRKWSETMSIDDFKYMMGVEDTYKQFSNLREKVIEAAVKQINENTKYQITVSYKKVSKTFVSVTFKYYIKGAKILATKDGEMSLDKIKAIVQSDQFMKDYNDYKLLSGEAKKDTNKFWSEMYDFLANNLKDFNKRPLEEYLKAPVYSNGRS